MAYIFQYPEVSYPDDLALFVVDINNHMHRIGSVNKYTRPSVFYTLSGDLIEACGIETKIGLSFDTQDEAVDFVQTVFRDITRCQLQHDWTGKSAAQACFVDLLCPAEESQ